MRGLFPALFAVGTFVAVSTSARAQDSTQAILDRAIQAHGGESKLASLKAGHVKSRSKLLSNGLELTQEVVYLLPSRFRETVTYKDNGQEHRMVSVYDGKQATLKIDGQEVPLNERLRGELIEAGYLLGVQRLLALKDKQFKLAPLGEANVEGKPAVGIRVSAEGHRDVNLFFDKATGRLAKLQRQATDPGTGLEFTDERIVTAYEMRDGLPTVRNAVVLRNGQKFMEVTVLEAKFLDKADDSEFTP
jgi:hypothetical protein